LRATWNTGSFRSLSRVSADLRSREHMAVYVQQNNPRRMAVFAGIVGFHLLLVYGLVSGLARKVVEVVAPPLVTDIIEEIKPEDKPPPPPPPQIERPPVQVPPPDVVIDIPMETATTAISNVTDKPVAPPPPRVVAGTPAKIGRMPSSEDYYPAAAKRAEEQGSTTVMFASMLRAGSSVIRPSSPPRASRASTRARSSSPAPGAIRPGRRAVSHCPSRVYRFASSSKSSKAFTPLRTSWKTKPPPP